MTTSEQPYNVFTDPSIAVDHGGPLDAVEAWEEAARAFPDYWSSASAVELVHAGDRLAKHATSLRGWVESFEQENHALRALVERAREFACTPWENLDYGGNEWIDDAERVLAADTGDDRG